MGGEAKDEKNFASAIGHKNVKSGGYLQKIADLRRYGFMEKGRFIATSNSKKIIQPLTNEEKQEALNECIMSVNLWRDLYDRLGDEIPSPEDFKIHLAEIGDRDRAYKEGDTIQNLYIDAMKHYDKGISHGFYVNFIVYMKDGSVGLFDTKSGRTAEDSKHKAEALANYIEKENKKGKKLWGGIAVFKEGSLRYNDSKKYKFDEANLGDDWKFLNFD